MWDWNEAGLSSLSQYAGKKLYGCTNQRGRGRETREDVYQYDHVECPGVYVVYKCVHIEVGMQIELSQTQQPQ